MSDLLGLQQAFARVYPNSVTFSATRAMLDRSNRTAFAEFRDVARESGVHDFADLAPGDRRHIPIHFLASPESGNELQWVVRDMTLNITPSTREHRFWIERLTNLVAVDDVLIVGFDEREGIVGANLYVIGGVPELMNRINERREQAEPRPMVALDQEVPGDLYEEPEATPRSPDAHARYAVISRRIIRDTALTKRVKELYEYRCQICQTRLVKANGQPYAEGAHIVPLSLNGPDAIENMLCLCPNHHVMLDSGAIFISEGSEIWDSHSNERIGELRRLDSHQIDESGFRIQRDLFVAMRSEDAD